MCAYMHLAFIIMNTIIDIIFVSMAINVHLDHDHNHHDHDQDQDHDHRNHRHHPSSPAASWALLAILPPLYNHLRLKSFRARLPTQGYLGIQAAAMADGDDRSEPGSVKTEPAVEGETWTCWGGKCPLGSQCSKRGATLKNCSTWEQAYESIVNHLMSSPYHQMDRDTAEKVVDYDLIDSWEVSKKDYDEHQRNVQETRLAQPKHAPRKRRSGEDAPMWPSSSSGAIAPRTPARAPNQGQGTTQVVLSEVQLRACVDSLKRAKVSAESAAHLCTRAGQAFKEEVRCIEQCAEVVESYLPGGLNLDMRRY